jgi:hypothetical protein
MDRNREAYELWLEEKINNAGRVEARGFYQESLRAFKKNQSIGEARFFEWLALHGM